MGPLFQVLAHTWDPATEKGKERALRAIWLNFLGHILDASLPSTGKMRKYNNLQVDPNDRFLKNYLLCSINKAEMYVTQL